MLNFNRNSPPDSAIGAFYVPELNVWLDEDGFEHSDLKYFGFTARQRQTILINITKFVNNRYACMPNNNGELVELYW